MEIESRKYFPKLLTCFCVMAISTSATFAVEIVAHRGASFDAPENTLASMKLAWKQKADAIETDIHLSKDGKLVVLHDFDTRRVAGVDQKILDQTFEDLRKLDVGKWKGENFLGEKIPTLDSILETIPNGKRIFIEIKIGAEIFPELEKVMKVSGENAEQLALITFKYDVARAAKERFPKHQVYWLSSWTKDKVTGQFPNIDEMIEQAKAAKLDGLDLNFGFPIDKEFVKKVHGAGLKLYTWTVDDAVVAKLEVEAGVDGITTNRPEFLRNELNLTPRRKGAKHD